MARKVAQDGPEGPPVEESKGAEAVNAPTAQSEPPTKLLLRVLPDLVILGGAVYFFVLARNFDYLPVPGQLGPSFWPQILSIGIAICAVVRLVQKIRLRERPAAAAQAEASEESEANVQWSRLALGVALVVGYVLGAIYLGYILSTAIFLIAFLYLGGQRKWYVFPLGLLGSLAFTYIFLKVVYVALPSGVGVFDQFSATIYQILGIY